MRQTTDRLPVIETATCLPDSIIGRLPPVGNAGIRIEQRIALSNLLRTRSVIPVRVERARDKEGDEPPHS